MASESDWVEDVRRWCLAGAQPRAKTAEAAESSIEIGYEAAHPALQSRHWPDAPRSGLPDPG